MTSDNPHDVAKVFADACVRLEKIMNEAECQARAEQRESERVDLYRQEVELHKAQHKAWLQERADVQAHRERIEQIEQERNKHFASMAESLGTMAKAVAEKR